ncbi:MAG: LysE family translocator, partial [Aestuariivirgaceae bacterium]|nr:LysE family translocator [Aestuariivirgaceae bacterium]
LMLLASGVNFGFRRTIPHMLGISLGFVFMAIPVGLGLGALFVALPQMQLVLKVVAGLYMLYLGWRIASASVMGEARANARPLTFWEAAAFQWVNPKAVFMAVTAMTTYTNPAMFIPSVLTVAMVFGVVNAPSVSAWAVFGAAMRNWLSDPKRLRLFNISMGLLLVLSLWPMLRA